MALKRKQLYLEVAQERRIKRWAKIQRVPEAEIIRRTIDLGLARLAAERFDKPRGATGEFLAEIDRLIGLGPVRGGRGWQRDDLYDRGSK